MSRKWHGNTRQNLSELRSAQFSDTSVTHYNRGRPHASLGPGFPEAAAAQNSLVAPGHHVPARCRVVATPILSGLHHEYRWVPEAA
jgi:putative transposase